MPNNPQTPVSGKGGPPPEYQPSVSGVKEKDQGQEPKKHPSPSAKRDEFRIYLEKTGVLDALTRVLVGLYEEPEKPHNPIEYFLERLAIGVPMKEQLQNLTSELDELQEKFREVGEDNVRLRATLEKHNVMPAAPEVPEADADFTVPDPPPPSEVDDDGELPVLSNVN